MCSLFLLLLDLVYLLDALAYPAHYWHSHTVADSFITRPVRAVGGRFTAPRYFRVPVREALQALALGRCKSAHLEAVGYGVAVGCGEGVADTAIVCANAVPAAVVLPANNVPGDANNVGIAAVLAIERKCAVVGAWVLPPVYDD